jgi:hypothetical protein
MQESYSGDGRLRGGRILQLPLMPAPRWDQPRYVREPLEVKPKAVHPLWRAAKHFVILYIVVCSVAFICEGALRLRHHIGSRAPIEKLATRGLRAKADVARQKQIERMEDDPLYLAYGGTMLLGALVMFIVLLVADARLIWKLMGKVDARFRVIVIVCVGMFAA